LCSPYYVKQTIDGEICIRGLCFRVSREYTCPPYSLCTRRLFTIEAEARVAIEMWDCEVGQALALEYEHALADYNRKMIECLGSINAEEASQKLKPLFDDCVLKRKALQRHTHEHKCTGERRREAKAT
jgi:hypothetical protein